MKRFKNFMMKFGGAIAAFVLFIGVFNSNSACFSIWHQPKEPLEMTKYKL